MLGSHEWLTRMAGYLTGVCRITQPLRFNVVVDGVDSIGSDTFRSVLLVLRCPCWPCRLPASMLPLLSYPTVPEVQRVTGCDRQGGFNNTETLDCPVRVAPVRSACL